MACGRGGSGSNPGVTISEFEACGPYIPLVHTEAWFEGNGNPKVVENEVPQFTHRKAWDKYGSDPIPVEIPAKVKR